MRIVTLPRSAALSLALLFLVTPLLGGCYDNAQGAESSIGNAAHGAALIRKSGCGVCHTIPGIEGADGLVGPPLTHIGARVYLAGVLRNTPDNMITWLRNPQAVVPNNAMPNLGLTARQARDITAYLQSLR